jgi:hypothetical protein
MMKKSATTYSRITVGTAFGVLFTMLNFSLLLPSSMIKMSDADWEYQDSPMADQFSNYSPAFNLHGSSVSFPEDAPPIPEWLADYIEFHRNSLEVDKKGKYKVKKGVRTLKLVKRSGGVGDRMYALIGQFYLAICHHRVFIAHPPGKLDLFLHPRLIQWNAQRASDSHTHFIYGAEKQLDNTTLLSTNATDIDMSGANLWHHYKRLKNNQCHRNLTLPSSLYDEYANVEEEKILYYYLYLSLFGFSSSVQHRTQAIRTHVGMDEASKPYIAVHIRTGDTHFNTKFKSSVRHAGEDVVPRFYNCSRQLQNQLQNCLKDNKSFTPKIYIASDKPETKTEFEQNDPKSIRFMDDMEIFHVDRSMKSDFKDPALAETDVWSELQILTESSCIVHSRSGFSELAAMVGSFPRCAIRFDECTEENILQAMANIGC